MNVVNASKQRVYETSDEEMMAEWWSIGQIVGTRRQTEVRNGLLR